MNALIDHHHATSAAASILTAAFDDPTGYGRIVRRPDGSVDRIVEHKDASDDERKISEINSGIYVFDRAPLFDALSQITPENVQHEYYLTDVFRILSASDRRVAALRAEHPDEIHGVNTFDQLQEAMEILSRRRSNRSA
jgi:bifunctional N-acetylglucosamine-1-phosphate-uridyltransferase/glucosamine-1-phosphate-acetyltransferase GlmU-like protein